MKFPTKEELEQLDSPLREYWQNEINWYWHKKLEEYTKWQEMTNPEYRERYVTKIGFNHLKD